jgi:hypothetical protein
MSRLVAFLAVQREPDYSLRPQLCLRILFSIAHFASNSAADHGGAPTRLGGPDSVVQNDVEQRPMNPDATVVFNKAEFAKAVHEEADA